MRPFFLALSLFLAAATAAAGEDHPEAAGAVAPTPWTPFLLAQGRSAAFEACAKDCKERYNACLAVRQAEYCRPAQERCLQACSRTAR